MARHPLPTKELKLHGSYNITLHGGRTDEDFPTLPVDAKIEPPDRLGESSKALWTIYTNRLVPLGALSDIDLFVLEEACLLFDELQFIEHDLSKVRSKKSKSDTDRLNWYKLNAMFIKTSHELDLKLCRFGATPSERAKIASLARTPKHEDENSILECLKSDE